MLPIRGTVLHNASNTLLVDLGKSDGVVKGAVFDVVKKGKIKTVDTGPGVNYNSNDILGTFTVDSTNEELAEGTYKKRGFYDTLNEGDEIILTRMPSDSSEVQSPDGNVVTDTRPAADSSGEPATKAAALAERESIKESFRVQAKESPLITMIQSIL